MKHHENEGHLLKFHMSKFSPSHCGSDSLLGRLFDDSLCEQFDDKVIRYSGSQLQSKASRWRHNTLEMTAHSVQQ